MEMTKDGEWADDEIVDVDEIPEMILEEEDKVEKEYEVLEGGRFGSEHNGTVRRWYRGFRH